MSPQARPPPQSGDTGRGCRSPPALGLPPPRGSRQGRAYRLWLRGLSARGGPREIRRPAGCGGAWPGAASLPGGHVRGEQAGGAADSFSRPPRRAGQRPARPPRPPGPGTHLRPGPGPGPVSAGSPQLRSRRRRNPRPAGAPRPTAPTAPPPLRRDRGRGGAAIADARTQHPCCRDSQSPSGWERLETAEPDL